MKSTKTMPGKPKVYQEYPITNNLTIPTKHGTKENAQNTQAKTNGALNYFKIENSVHNEANNKPHL